MATSWWCLQSPWPVILRNEDCLCHDVLSQHSAFNPGDIREDPGQGQFISRQTMSVILLTQVRPITENDVLGYHQCLDLVARERRFLAFLEAPPPENSLNFVRRQLKSGEPMLVAEHDGQIVGWCDICRHSMPGFTHRGALGMGVHPAFRRQGVGRRLLDAALAAAKKAGIERVELEVFAANTPAIQLYHSVRFAEEGRLQMGRKLEGVSEAIVVMARLFDGVA